MHRTFTTVTKQHIAQNEEEEGRSEENAELLINYNKIDTEEKQNIPEKIVEPMKKDNLPNPQNLRRIESEIEREDQTLWMKLYTLHRQVTLLKTTSSSSVGH